MITLQAFDEYFTPYRYGKPVIEGSGEPGAFDSCSVDVPFVFFHNGRYQMMYTGFDGIGYQTALAESEDLLHWTFQGLMLERNQSNRWDSTSICGTWLLKEDDSLSSVGRLLRWQGKYWMVYHAYPKNGYEEGPAEIGLAFCTDETLLHWTKMEQPIVSWRGGADWERGGLYKACLLKVQDIFYLFYNAKNEDEPWVEQTGLCTSKDLLHWVKSPSNPLLKADENRWDSLFASDPYIVRDGDQWLMFYYGYDGHHAQNGIASSQDLLHWEKADAPILTHGADGELDSIHAHKPSIIAANGVLYHFYCACREHRPGDLTEVWKEYRTITVAASKPFPE